MSEMQCISPKGNVYGIVKKIFDGKEFTIYACVKMNNASMIQNEGQVVSLKKIGQLCFLKIAKKKQNNSILDKEAMTFGFLSEALENFERIFRSVDGSEYIQSFNFLFPELLESFVSQEQRGRRINILNLSPIAKSKEDLMPLSFIRNRMKSRVDPKTSAWIIGRLLKMLMITHAANIYNMNLTCSNALINRDEHYLCVLDWTKAEIKKTLSTKASTAEIAAVGNIAYTILGGDRKTGKLPDHPDLVDARYSDLIFKIASGEYDDPGIVFNVFYETVRDLWQKGKHPFTTIKL